MASPPTTIPSTCSPSNHAASVNEMDQTPSSRSHDQRNYVKPSPLVYLFKESKLITTQLETPNSNERSTAFLAKNRIETIQDAVASLLPTPADLDIILQWTEKYWPIWPPCHYGPNLEDMLQPGKLTEAKQFLVRELKSRSAGTTSKALLWLTLCVQQLPRAVLGNVQLPMPQPDLVNVYVSLAKSLLEIDDDSGGSLDGVSCMNMKFKVYINMGKPQRAWHWTRQAVSASVNLGLHRASWETNPCQALNWMLAWTPERFMALILGLPSSVSSSHPGVSLEANGATPLDRIRWVVATVGGKVIDRDQNSEKEQYATTVQISQELEEGRDEMPEEWWQARPADLPLAEYFLRQSSKTLYFITLKLLHLPYMLRSIKEKKYRHSWDTAMEAARGIATSYIEFRAAPYADSDLCQLMDFQAFSGAIVLVIGHLLCPERTDEGTRSSDWVLIEDVGLALRRTAITMDCPVATQAAQTLEVLNSARKGGYVSPEDYNVVIPYFGQVRINQKMATGYQDNGTGQNTAVPNCIEFSMNEFISNYPLQPDFDLELEADWADPALFDLNVNWAEIYTNTC
ncbi:hypothetical protein VHEMI00600 [[Torrubiella] hemipterigena]|uniref:Transcription factor domain-containing protein n=1 Tax=[Torrubiella] hemipterigena TaxID=1531966 RepID=A0A0A1SJN7_9HYPO|nr:hypothetical protein VHEMI00600 [[Torrubiella] hemipterigena]